MLDIKYIRENKERVEQAIKNKNEKANVEELLELDAKKRQLQFKFDKNRAYQKKVSRDIPVLKKKGKDVAALLAEMKEISTKLKEIQEELKNLNTALDVLLLTIPNIPDADVPVGKDEAANEWIREWGTFREFSFEPLEHIDLAERNSLLDFTRPSKLSGSGFMAYTNKGAQLERALINFMLDYHIQHHDYEEIALPIIVNRATMTGTGQLPKLENDMYHVEEDDLFLIPTAEVSITNYFREEILSYKQLPIRLVSYSPCFRREAGSYGKDTKGLQRLHQFNKVEMVQLVQSGESDKALIDMLSHAENILQQLQLPYRVLKLATGDLSFASAKTFDIEVWAPGAKKFLEVSSVSNFRDFQARRASLRYRNENDNVTFMNTLNGSGLATPRTLIAILENYQLADGRIEVPKVLRPYLQDAKVL